MEVLVHVKDLESYKGQTQQKLLFPTENTAPETPPQLSCLLFLCLCDITLRHRVTPLHSLCLAATLAGENTFQTADPLFLLLLLLLLVERS